MKDLISSEMNVVSWELLQEEVNSFFKNLPLNTQIAYKNDISQFFHLLQLKKIHPLKVRQIHVEEFMKFISLKGGRLGIPASDRTYNRKLASLKAFYGFLGEKRVIELDPTSFVRLKRMGLRVETNDLSNEKVKELFEIIPKDNFKHARDRALLGVFFYTGCRRAELLGLDFDDYTYSKKIRILKFKIKGGGVREAPVNPELQKMLDLYLEMSKREGFEHKKDLPLFVSCQQRKRFSPSSINLIFKRWTRKLKLPYSVSPHSARATLIGVLHDNGVSLREQAETVAHSDINMTNAYNKRKKQLEESPLLKQDLFSK